MNRFDFIERSNASQSGLTCLSMICRYYGRHVNLTATLSHYVSTEKSLELVSSNAEKLGLSCVTGYLPISKKLTISRETIEEGENTMFNHCYVADPTKGLIKYSQAEVKRHCVNSHIANEEKVVAVFIKPTDEFYKQAEEQNQLIKENSIWRYIKHLFSWKK